MTWIPFLFRPCWVKASKSFKGPDWKQYEWTSTSAISYHVHCSYWLRRKNVHHRVWCRCTNTLVLFGQYFHPHPHSSNGNLSETFPALFHVMGVVLQWNCTQLDIVARMKYHFTSSAFFHVRKRKKEKDANFAQSNTAFTPMLIFTVKQP